MADDKKTWMRAPVEGEWFYDVESKTGGYIGHQPRFTIFTAETEVEAEEYVREQLRHTKQHRLIKFALQNKDIDPFLRRVYHSVDLLIDEHEISWVKIESEYPPHIDGAWSPVQ